MALNNCTEALPLQTMLGDLKTQFAELLVVLRQETQILAARDLDALGEICELKAHITHTIRTLEHDLAASVVQPSHAQPSDSAESWLTRRIAAEPQATRQKLEPLHTELRLVMVECREQNAVNGKIVHRSQQSMQELMKIVNGTAGDSLYTSQGTAPISGDGTPLAQA